MVTFWWKLHGCVISTSTVSLLLRLSGFLDRVWRTARRKCQFCAKWQILNLRIWRCAAAQRFCSVYAHAETLCRRKKKTAAPDWAPCPAFAACSFDGKRRCARGSSSYLVGRRMSGGSGSQTGAPSAALCLQDLRISRLHTQWRSQNIFTGGGGGAEWDHCSHRGGTQTYLC